MYFIKFLRAFTLAARSCYYYCYLFDFAFLYFIQFLCGFRVSELLERLVKLTREDEDGGRNNANLAGVVVDTNSDRQILFTSLRYSDFQNMSICPS